MDSSNLATVFGPNILRRGKTSRSQLDSVDEVAQNADVVSAVKDLIDFHSAVFRVCRSFRHSNCVSMSSSQISLFSLFVSINQLKQLERTWNNYLIVVMFNPLYNIRYK